MYDSRMRPIILKAMDYNIRNLSTYHGYNGAELLKFTFHDNEELVVVRDYCRKLGFETAVKMNDCVELFCIFEVDEDVYSLKI